MSSRLCPIYQIYCLCDKYSCSSTSHWYSNGLLVSLAMRWGYIQSALRLIHWDVLRVHLECISLERPGLLRSQIMNTVICTDIDIQIIGMKYGIIIIYQIHIDKEIIRDCRRMMTTLKPVTICNQMYTGSQPTNSHAQRTLSP